jgi:paraquat-inducible protein A
MDRVMALAVAALIIFIVANAEPLMALSISGLESSTTILGGVVEMWRQGEWITSVLIALFAVVAPGLKIAFTLVIVFAVRRPPASRWVGTLVRWTEVSGLWSMVEVMMLGILVALVKIADLARVVPGIGIFCAAALVVLMTAISVSFDPAEVWSRVRWANGELPPESPGSAGDAEAGP